MDAASVVITFEDARYEDKEMVLEENPVEVLKTSISKLCETLMNTLCSILLLWINFNLQINNILEKMFLRMGEQMLKLLQ